MIYSVYHKFMMCFSSVLSTFCYATFLFSSCFFFIVAFIARYLLLSHRTPLMLSLLFFLFSLLLLLLLAVVHFCFYVIIHKNIFLSGIKWPTKYTSLHSTLSWFSDLFVDRIGTEKKHRIRMLSAKVNK